MFSGDFLRDVFRQPMLTPEQERDLARRSIAGDHSAAEQLVASHLRVVVKIARSYRGSGVALQDLVQEGTLGLLQAVRKFNPDQKDARLSTYALWWIRAAIQDQVIRSISLVRTGTTTAQKSLILALRKKLKNGADHLSEDLAARLAEHFRTTRTEVRALARRLTVLDSSLNQPVGENSAEEWIDRIPCPAPSPEDIVAARSDIRFRNKVVNAAMAMLSPRERIIIARRYLSEACPSLDAVSREVGLSKERVRQLEKAALGKLREILTPKLAER